ncbi:predicted protein [Histoplasma capsulatum H143]|uniref:Uncharacterized protein n=1 Tax=Ajellomyces capsulatus (strain H143) TaxID=544712 RepID=C6HIS7_AJECH|nr:predicted protein [Histoplasma capsulatum H143]
MSGRSSIGQRSLAISSSRSADSAKGRIVAAKRPSQGWMMPAEAATTGRSAAIAHAQCPMSNVLAAGHGTWLCFGPRGCMIDCLDLIPRSYGMIAEPGTE